MTQETVQPIATETDWPNLIEDAQTDPEGLQGEAAQRLFLEIYPWINQLAGVWLRSHRYSEAHEGALVSLGVEHVLRKLDRFEIRSEDPGRVGRSFKAWVTKSCRRRWTDEITKIPEESFDPSELEEMEGRTAPSPEALLEEEQTPERTLPELALMRRIVREELEALPEHMADAIRETEALKDPQRPNARGRTGESAAIADRYHLTPTAIRTARSRLIKRIQRRYEKESSS